MPFNMKILSDLSPKDQEAFQTYSKGADVMVPFATVTSAFGHHVSVQPTARAVVDPETDRTLTYDQLDVHSNSLAMRMLRNGLQPGQSVCLLVKRSVEMVVAIMAVLKAGCQYVPLDAGVITDETLQVALEDTGCKMILVTKGFE